MAIVAVVAVGAFVIGNHNSKKTVTVKTTTTNAQGQKQTQTKTVEVTKATDIQSTLAAWKAAGFTVSPLDTAYYQLVGASNGSKYEVGQTEVELYEFSDSTKANNAKAGYFTAASDTVLVTGTLLVDIHSTDATQVNPITAVFLGMNTVVGVLAFIVIILLPIIIISAAVQPRRARRVSRKCPGCGNKRNNSILGRLLRLAIRQP